MESGIFQGYPLFSDKAICLVSKRDGWLKWCCLSANRFGLILCWWGSQVGKGGRREISRKKGIATEIMKPIQSVGAGKSVMITICWLWKSMSISSFNRNDIYRCWHLHLWFPEAVADLIQSIVGDNNQRRVQIYGTIPTRRLYPESITGSGTHR